jgi:hypothetical protein
LLYSSTEPMCVTYGMEGSSMGALSLLLSKFVCKV